MFARPQHAAALFREALPLSVSDAIAWHTLTLQPGSFMDEEFADRHSDLLFSVPLGDVQALLYVLFEHQSTNEPHMPLRVLDYSVKAWMRERKQDDTRLSFSLTIVDLVHLTNEELEQRALDAFPKLALWLLRSETPSEAR